MNNAQALLATNNIGKFPEIKLNTISAAAVICLGFTTFDLAGLIIDSVIHRAYISLFCIALMWVIHRYITKFDNNDGWFFLTDPPDFIVDDAVEVITPDEFKVCNITTELINKVTGDSDLVAEDRRSHQYRVLVVRNDNPRPLMSVEITETMAIRLGANIDSIKFEPVFEAGASAFLVPLPRSEWQEVPLLPVSKSDKPVVQLGEDLNGNPVSVDLIANPHTLVAGSTGSGKTAWMMVYIQSLIDSGIDPILYIIDPNDNLGSFEDVALNSGGCFTSSLDEGVSILEMLTVEPKANPDMSKEEQVKELHPHNFVGRKSRMKGSQNIWKYRQRVKETDEDHLEDDTRMIVVVVDEAAAFTESPDKDIKKASVSTIGAIGRRHRASGACLLIATQRPSTDVFPSELKSNCGNIIAFSHTSKVSSRVTLDEPDAANIPNLGGFVAKFNGSSELIKGRATYLDL